MNQAKITCNSTNNDCCLISEMISEDIITSIKHLLSFISKYIDEAAQNPVRVKHL